MNLSRLWTYLISFGSSQLSIFKTVLLFIGLMTISSWAVAFPAVDLVFDLDWTLINPTTEKMARYSPENVIHIEGHSYRITDHTVSTLIALHSQPDVRISYFSGGSVTRNKMAIKEIYKRIHAVQKNSDFQPYKILSVSDLTEVNTDSKLKFTQRFKKDLGRFFDLNFSVLVDDVLGFILPGQEKNQLWLGKTYNDRVQFELAHLEDPKGKDYSAPDHAEWQRDRNKLLPIYGLILNALNSSRTKARPFIESIIDLQKKQCSQVF